LPNKLFQKLKHPFSATVLYYKHQNHFKRGGKKGTFLEPFPLETKTCGETFANRRTEQIRGVIRTGWVTSREFHLLH